MSLTPEFDKTSFPGGYDITDILVAVKISASKHVQNPPFGETERAIFQRFLVELAARHPGGLPFDNLYRVRSQELFDERRSLLNSHLKFTWFALAYWAYGLVAVRSRLSLAEYDDLNIFLTPAKLALRELGIQVSDQECLAEVDRFVPATVTPRNVEAAAHTFLSFVRFLHHGALRRREVVTPALILPSVSLAFVPEDAKEADSIVTFLIAHSISIAAEPIHPDRLLVLLSREALSSELFWHSLAEWKERGVIPMVVCLLPKTELYRAPPAGSNKEVWEWLSANVAVELSSETDRYLILLRALDSTDPKQWWWNKDDALDLGLAVDVIGLGIPRPALPRKAVSPTKEPYPLALQGMLLSACLIASERLQNDGTNGRDARYFAICQDLVSLRQKPNGEPYSLAWFILIYRAWLSFATHLPGFVYSDEDFMHAEQELRAALFALGVGSDPREVPPFLDAFAKLPWATPPATLAAVDDRAGAFIVLVNQLAQAALARGQRMRLRHPTCSAFVSYARPDESFARELVTHLEAKGADVWWDLNSITLGTPLGGALRSAVGDARFLLLVATKAADESTYVRLELETAIRQGLRIVPLCLESQMPPGLGAVLASVPNLVEPVIHAADSERANAPAAALARLERSPAEQLEWLLSLSQYRNLRQHIAQARAGVG